MTKFDPTTDLERVNSASDLKVGDKYLRAYFDSEGNFATGTVETMRDGNSVDYLFDSNTHRRVYFVEKVKRHVDPTLGHFGIATLEDGTRQAGFWDADGDFTTAGATNRTRYIGAVRITDFEDLGLVTQPTLKTEGLIPGRDPKPDTDYVWDKDGDKWRLNPDAPQSNFDMTNRTSRTWDNPAEDFLAYAPYRTTDPRA